MLQKSRQRQKHIPVSLLFLVTTSTPFSSFCANFKPKFWEVMFSNEIVWWGKKEIYQKIWFDRQNKTSIEDHVTLRKITD